MFKFRDKLLTRSIKNNELRKQWDKKINYSYNNYLAINAIGELRMELFSLLTGSPTLYRRDFK